MKKYLRLFLCPVSALRGNFGAALLRRQLDFKKYLLAGSLLVALNAAFQTWASGLLMRVEQPSLVICLCAALMTWAIYTADKLSSSSEDAINSPERAKLLDGRERSLKIACFLAAFLSVILVASARIAALPFLLITPLAALLYVARIPGFPRIKDIPLAKNLIVGVSWGAGVVGVNGWSWPVFAFMFSSVFINSVICDIRDIEGDRLNKVRTIPVLLGTQRTKLTLGVLASCMWVMLPIDIYPSSEITNRV